MNNTSVIMVSYYTGPVLMPAIASVLMQEGLAQLIIVDNGNPPDMIARLRQMELLDPRLHMISGHGNIGFAAGCNLGVKHALGEELLLLNPDCLLPPGALNILLREREKLPNTLLAGGYLVNPDGSEQRGARRPLLTPLTAFAACFGRHSVPAPLASQSLETHDVPAISGACMYLRRRDYEALGGMDERFFLHVEDLDFCARVRKAGRRIVCVPAVKIVHLRATSGQVQASRIEYLKARGFELYFQKYAQDLTPGLLPLLRFGIWVRYGVRRLFPGSRAHDMLAQRRMLVLASSWVQPPMQNAFTGNTVLLFGATSQIGVYVIQQLLASGAAVIAVSRHAPPPFQHPNLHWVQQDMTQPEASLQGYGAESVVHCAPLWQLPKLLPLLASVGVKRLVAVGSTSVFTKALSRSGYERDLVERLRRAERELPEAAAAAGIGWTLLRPTMVYGAGMDQNITAWARVIRKFRYACIYPPAVGRRQPVHAQDVAVAALQALSSDAALGQSYNISGGESMTYREMLERVFDKLKLRPRIYSSSLLPVLLAIAGWVLRKPHLTPDMARRMNEDFVFFHDDAVRDFGYHPRGFLTGGSDEIG